MRGPDEPDVVALQPKRTAVLSYLAVARPGPLHRRDSLLAMFWPEHDVERGRNALSKTLHHLRRSLPPGAIVTEGDQVGIDRTKLWVDVTEFTRALERGQTEEALALYQGDLLRGFHILAAPEFDHWIDVEGSRLRRTVVAAAWALASDAEEAGDGARATKWAWQAVGWAPRDESGFRRLLALLHDRGNRAEALEAFETFARKLQQDYGVEPASPTLELIDAIREGTLPSNLATPPVPRSTPSRSPSPPLVSVEATTRQPPDSETSPGTSVQPSPPPRRTVQSRWKLIAAGSALAGATALAVLLNLPGQTTLPAIRVLVTEFDDGTNESLGAVMSDALRIDLAESRALKLVDPADVAETLELMGLESNARISAAVGREIAVRDGVEALVEGAVVQAGPGYILTASILEGDGGRTISSFRESVTTPDQLIPAIDRLSLEVREALGERPGTIEGSVPLQRVTTSSLEALRLYTKALRVFDEVDDRSDATSLLQRAVAIDPSFAMAWRMLAVALQGADDQTLRIEAARQAFQHRDRLSELERHTVEASYHSVVQRDRSRAVQSLLRALELDPDHATALNNLGVNYLYMAEPQRAEEVFRRLVEMPGSPSTAYRNLIDTRLSLGLIEGAAETLARFEQAYPDHALLPSRRVQTLLLSGALNEARALARSTAEDPLQPAASRADMWMTLARMAYWEGRRGDARTALLEAERVDGQADVARAWARVVDAAYMAALVGDGTWAREHAEANVRSGSSDDIVLRGPVTTRMVEVQSLTSMADQSHHLMMAGSEDPTGLRDLYERIETGDTTGVRTIIEKLPLHRFQRVLLFERLGDLERTIDLYEQIVQPGFTGWGQGPHQLRALMRLGPLYEQAADTLRAIDAYRAHARQWASGDSHGRSISERHETRARALEARLGTR